MVSYDNPILIKIEEEEELNVIVINSKKINFMWRTSSDQEEPLLSAEAHKEMVSFPVTTYTRQLWSTRDEEDDNTEEDWGQFAVRHRSWREAS